jgi:hypothetical protein
MYTDTNIHLCDIERDCSNSLSEISVEKASSKNAPLNGQHSHHEVEREGRETIGLKAHTEQERERE